MKEYPQPSCTNCDKNNSSWCVCKKCRSNSVTIKRLFEMLRDTKEWKPETKLERHDKRIVYSVIRYAITGKYKKPKVAK